MDKIREYLIIAKLISKEIMGLNDSDEENKLQNWMTKNDNRDFYARLSNGEGRSERQKIKSTIDIDKEWSTFVKKSSKRSNKYFIRNVLRYAAVIMPIVIVSFLMFSRFGQIDKITEVAENTVIKPGEGRAQLVLSNGLKIDLSKLNEVKLSESNGTQIKRDKNSVIYSNKDGGSDKSTLYNTINIPKGGEYMIRLSDGTKVWLNSMSSMKYPVAFNDSLREVELSGEAYFEVEKNAKKPFIVKTKSYSVKVLGTSFNVSSYEGEDIVHTTLTTGKVQLKGLSGNSKSYTIIPGQQFSYNKYTRESNIKEVDTAVYTSWKDGFFMFDETRLEEVLLELQRWYDVEIFYNNKDMKDEVFTGKMPRFEDLNTILKMMNKVGNIKYRLKGKVLYVG